ncbi:pyridoxamine 5'-phosphate oxidase family protein [Microbacterium hatanonis]|nr:pyridoxamine 5'-phosphate oxidase family protein [Microbacterium hatanonis]
MTTSRPTAPNPGTPFPPAGIWGVNPYLLKHRVPSPTPSPLGVESLSVDDCWHLLERADFGRIAIDGVDGVPDLFPLNYLAADGHIFMRSAPGAKLRGIANNPDVAFEVDGDHDGLRWSVVVRGIAERMSVDFDIEESGVLSLVSANPTDKQNFLRLTPRTVNGRTFRSRKSSPTHRGPAEELAVVVRVEAPRSAKPRAIPHFAPFLEVDVRKDRLSR